ICQVSQMGPRRLFGRQTSRPLDWRERSPRDPQGPELGLAGTKPRTQLSPPAHPRGNQEDLSRSSDSPHVTHPLKVFHVKHAPEDLPVRRLGPPPTPHHWIFHGLGCSTWNNARLEGEQAPGVTDVQGQPPPL